MPKRRKLDLEFLLAASNIECPHCRAILTPADFLRLDSVRLRCKWCEGEFLAPQKSGSSMQTN